MDECNVARSMRRRRRRVFGAAQCWAMARQCMLGLSLALACQSALAQSMYRITPLGLLSNCTSPVPEALAFNGAGQVTGTACNANGDTHAFLWKNDGTPMVDLGPPQGGFVSYGTGINASGLVAGNSSDSTGEFAFLSRGHGKPMKRIYDSFGGDAIYPSGPNALGQLTGSAFTAGDAATRAFLWRNDRSPLENLGTLGGDSSSGNAINGSGQVAGTSDLPGNADHHAFFWKNNGTPMLNLGTLGGHFSEGLFINASGQVAGTSRVNVTGGTIRTHVFLWRNDGTPMHDLGALGGYDDGFPMALNNSGQIAGSSHKHFHPNSQHAFVWLNEGTPMQDLGTFGGNASHANDMNSSGQVTGQANDAHSIGHAFLWRHDGTKIQDLNRLIDPADPLKAFITFTEGNFINDSGDIEANGTDSRTGMVGQYLLHATR
jgi:probable HAF family extracellular repeat protein